MILDGVWWFSVQVLKALSPLKWGRGPAESVCGYVVDVVRRRYRNRPIQSPAARPPPEPLRLIASSATSNSKKAPPSCRASTPPGGRLLGSPHGEEVLQAPGRRASLHARAGSSLGALGASGRRGADATQGLCAHAVARKMRVLARCRRASLKSTSFYKD